MRGKLLQGTSKRYYQGPKMYPPSRRQNSSMGPQTRSPRQALVIRGQHSLLKYCLYRIDGKLRLNDCIVVAQAPWKVPSDLHFKTILAVAKVFWQSPGYKFELRQTRGQPCPMGSFEKSDSMEESYETRHLGRAVHLRRKIHVMRSGVHGLIPYRK